MTSKRPIFLVSIQLPDPPEISDALIELLAETRVVLLGTYVVSDQTSPEQARDQFEDEARETLSEVETSFRDDDQIIETRLVFSPDFSQTLERIEDELEYDAIVLPRACGPVKRALVALSGDVDFDRVETCVGQMFKDRDIELTLLSIESDEEDVDEKELLLDGLQKRLVDRGIAEERISVESTSAPDPAAAAEAVADDYDLVVLAEREEAILESLFEAAWNVVAESLNVPAVVVKVG